MIFIKRNQTAKAWKLKLLPIVHTKPVQPNNLFGMFKAITG
jgi:hypothetical protein